jgi:glutaredoxin
MAVMHKQLGLALTLLLACTAAIGQYKVIGPDGKVTYTDQPPTDGKSKVQPFKAGSSANDPDLVLPFATAQALRNFPVTLYTQEGCVPCDAGRTLLRARGIPFEEKTISTQAELDAYKAISRDGQLPLLAVGREQVAGYEAGRWNNALSSAGYPANTTLPNGYVAKKSALVPAPAAAAAAAPAPSPATAATNPRPEASPGFRFQK